MTLSPLHSSAPRRLLSGSSSNRRPGVFGLSARVLLALAGASAASAPFAAQQPLQDQAQEQQDEAPSATASDVPDVLLDERGRKCLVHLADGRVLRVRARHLRPQSDVPTSTGSWEMRDGRDWKRLPEQLVSRVVLEKDVLQRAKRLESELGRTPEPGRRVAYADWLLREGLMAEGADALRKVLAQDPDQPQALELVRRAALDKTLNVSLPALSLQPDRIEASLGQFGHAAGRSGPLGLELAVLRLSSLHAGAAPHERAEETSSAPDLEPLLRAELHAQSKQRRTFAARALRRLFPGEEVRPLLGRAILDSSRDVRHEAALALRDVGDEAVLVPAVRALGSKHSAVRDNAVSAMAVMGYPAAVPSLVTHLATLQSVGSGRPPHSHIFVGRQFAYVQDFDVEVAQGAAVADPIINVGVEGAVLDAAVISTRQTRIQTELANTRRALTRLTGASPGNTVRAWERWWSENGDAWMATQSPGPPAAPDSPGR